MQSRRTFVGVLAGICGAIFGAFRFLRPGSWGQPILRQNATTPEQNTTPTSNASNLVITTRRLITVAPGKPIPPSEETFYLRENWRRLENSRMWSGKKQADGSVQTRFGPRIVSIVRPDLGRRFELNLDASEYSSTPDPPPAPKRPKPITMATGKLKAPDITEFKKRKSTFQIETTTQHTGERKEMFGYTARHVITTRSEIPREGSLRPPQKTVDDGWYIDLNPQLYPSLYPPPDPEKLQKVPQVSFYLYDPVEKPEVIDIGKPETGFAVHKVRVTKRTHKLPDGTERPADQREETFVTLEERALDPALFEVPPGFKRVDYIDRDPEGTADIERTRQEIQKYLAARQGANPSY
jgi:hypothetical protein